MSSPLRLPSRRAAMLRLAVFCALAVVLFGGVAASPFLLNHVSRVFPDNYLRRGNEALARGDSRAAEAIAQRRIARVGWDMNARFLLARAQAAAGNPQAAADSIKESLRLAVTARGRQITVTGYDEPLMLHLLAGYLWEAGQYQFAGEMYRAAIDTAAADGTGNDVPFGPPQLPDREAAEAAARVFLKLKSRAPFEGALATLESEAAASPARSTALALRARWSEEVDRNSPQAIALLQNGPAGQITSPAVLGNPQVRLELAAALRRTGQTSEALLLEHEVRNSRGMRPADLESFTLPVGGVATSASLQLSRRGTASGSLPTGSYRATNLLLHTTGAPAFGQWPILILAIHEREVTRLYLDGLQPKTYDLPLWPEGVPRNTSLSMTFLNDAYDPVTRADRDIRIEFLALH